MSITDYSIQKEVQEDMARMMHKEPVRRNRTHVEVESILKDDQIEISVGITGSLEGEVITHVDPDSTIREWFQGQEDNPWIINSEELYQGVIDRLEDIAEIVDISVITGSLIATYKNSVIRRIKNDMITPFLAHEDIIGMCKEDLRIALLGTLNKTNNWYGKPIMFRMYFGEQYNYYVTDLDIYKDLYVGVDVRYTDKEELNLKYPMYIENRFVGYSCVPCQLRAGVLDAESLATEASLGGKIKLFSSAPLGKDVTSTVTPEVIQHIDSIIQRECRNADDHGMQIKVSQDVAGRIYLDEEGTEGVVTFDSLKELQQSIKDNNYSSGTYIITVSGQSITDHVFTKPKPALHQYSTRQEIEQPALSSKASRKALIAAINSDMHKHLKAIDGHISTGNGSNKLVMLKHLIKYLRKCTE